MPELEDYCVRLVASNFQVREIGYETFRKCAWLIFHGSPSPGDKTRQRRLTQNRTGVRADEICMAHPMNVYTVWKAK